MPENIAAILASLKRELQKILGDQLETVVLYGSQARGEAGPDSDVDVLVILRGEFDYYDMIERTSIPVASLSLENDLLISLAFVSVEQYHQRRTPFVLNVRREGITV